MKDGKEWKKPQQWRSFEREGGARDTIAGRIVATGNGGRHATNAGTIPTATTIFARDSHTTRCTSVPPPRSGPPSRGGNRPRRRRRSPSRRTDPGFGRVVGGDGRGQGSVGHVAKQREEKKMPKDVKKQPQQRSKPSATAAPFEPKAKSRLDGSAPAFEREGTDKGAGAEKG